jgi:uncharacterized protein (TIGR01777 family)
LKVIITGGTGFIGRALAAKLIERGDDVVVLTRDRRHAAQLPLGVTTVTWDGRTSNGWTDQIGANTAIVNLAGAGLADARWSEARKQELRDSRLNAGRAVVTATRLAATPPRVVVQASAVGYYGSSNDRQLCEMDGPGSDFLAHLCVDWEASTRDVEQVGVRQVILRSGLVLGRSGGALPRLLLPFRWYVGGPLGSGRQWVSWIHLADEVAAIVYLIDRESASGAYNFTAPNPVTNAELARSIGRSLGRPSFVPAPALALRLLFGEMATVLLDGQRVGPERLVAAGFSFQFAQIDGALADVR